MTIIALGRATCKQTEKIKEIYNNAGFEYINPLYVNLLYTRPTYYISEIHMIECVVPGVKGYYIKRNDPVACDTFWEESVLGQVANLLQDKVPEFTSYDAENQWWPEDDKLLYIAAESHCLLEAYAGKCPGIDPEKMLDHRGITAETLLRVKDFLKSCPVEDGIVDVGKNFDQEIFEVAAYLGLGVKWTFHDMTMVSAVSYRKFPKLKYDFYNYCVEL
jgi:hypothetical protein